MKFKFRWQALITLTVVMLLSACGGGISTPPPPPPPPTGVDCIWQPDATVTNWNGCDWQ